MDIRKVDLNLLPVLDALLRHRSVTRAALELDMSQSALSSALARLRRVLGDPLFVRTGRGLLPTARASRLGAPVAEILDQVREQVLAPERFAPREATRVFTLCLSHVGSYVLWPGIVGSVRRQAPALGLRLASLEPPDIPSALERGEVDLAIGAYPDLPDTLFQRRLFERAYVALVREGHPLAGRRLGLRAFAQAEHAVVPSPAGIQERIDHYLAAEGGQRRRRLPIPSYLMLPPLLEASDAVAVVPGQLAEAFAAVGRFRTLRLPFELPPSVVRLHWHRRFHEDAGNAWLRDLIVGTLAPRE